MVANDHLITIDSVNQLNAYLQLVSGVWRRYYKMLFYNNDSKQGDYEGCC